MVSRQKHGGLCSSQSRRIFLADCGMGLTGMVLGGLLGPNASAAAPDGKPHFAPKAKRVIWLFMLGGVSHLESFDPKPGLAPYAGMKIGDSPFKDKLASPFVNENVQKTNSAPRQINLAIYPMQCGSKQYGQSGIEV